MKARIVLTIVFSGLILSILAGCEPTAEMKLNLAPQSETTYKVVLATSKDYSFVQPSINKTKERHTVGSVEMVFDQKIESVDAKGQAIADITIKELKYVSGDAQSKTIEFDSTTKAGRSDPLYALIGQSYQIKITPKGKIEVVDAAAVRGIIKEDSSAKKFADRFFSDEEIAKRHQVLALEAEKKTLVKKGDSWSVIVPSPQGMLRPKSFEKVYTLTDIKEQNGQKIAVVNMKAVPSLKRAQGIDEKESAAMSFFADKFDEKDNYTGKMVLNLTTGQIENYKEELKAEWLAMEPSKQQKADKGPDQLTMGFTNLYSIEKIK